MEKIQAKDHLIENLQKNTVSQQNWRASCLEENRRGSKGPHLDDLISLVKEFELYPWGKGNF